VNLDSVRIYQVISNLVENAIKYSPEESPIDISVVAGEDTIKVEVKDHGPAIATEIRDNLFKPFTRGDGEKAEKAGGLGLGLYICRSIIELHNGEIGFYSNDGDGNTFYFSIPRRSD
jgi:signal transduction histidine kinase